MLPPGFRWRTYLDGPALYCGAMPVAYLSPVMNGVRVQLHPSLRNVFFSSEARAKVYVEAWASKWREDIARHVRSSEASRRTGWDGAPAYRPR